MSIPELLEHWKRLDHLGLMPCPSCSATSTPEYEYEIEDLSNLYRSLRELPRIIAMTLSDEMPGRYRVECQCGTSGCWANSEEEATRLWNCRPILDALRCAMSIHAEIRKAGIGFMAAHDVPKLCQRIQDYDREVLRILREHRKDDR